MKTAVEKIIAEIDKEVDWLETHQHVTEVRGRMIGLAFAKRVALELKELEKEQMKKFYGKLQVDENNLIMDFENYYNQTFKQQEQ